MVGGASRTPRLHEMISEFFDGEVSINADVNPDEVVAHGAAIMAGVLSG